eukprot:767240-Amphidinium_carterae.2
MSVFYLSDMSNLCEQDVLYTGYTVPDPALNEFWRLRAGEGDGYEIPQRRSWKGDQRLRGELQTPQLST